MTLCGSGITSNMILSKCWDDGYGYHIGLEVMYVIGLLVRKERFYLEPKFSTLHMKNQDIMMFKSGSVISWFSGRCTRKQGIWN